MAYLSKLSNVQDAQLKVQMLVLPFAIASGGASAVVDDPSVLALKTAQIDQVTAMLGSDSVVGYATPADATGIFNVLVNVGEPVKKVLRAEMLKRNGNTIQAVTFPNAAALSVAGNKIALNIDSPADLTAAALDATLVVYYIIDESQDIAL